MLVLVLIITMSNAQPCLEEGKIFDVVKTKIISSFCLSSHSVEDNCKGIEYMCCGWACVMADDMRLWWVCDYDDSNAERVRQKLFVNRLKRAYLLK